MSPSLHQEARAALRELDLKPKKRLGQNFLVHEGVLETIVRLLDIGREDEVVEIGPGLGFLTRRLVEAAKKVWAVEIDARLIEWLRRGPLGDHPKLDLIHDDILKVRFDELLPARKVKLVGNLPYSISTPVLFRLFELRDHFSFLVLMVQREVAERMAASPGTKAYGTLSVWCRLHGRISDKVSVSPEAFFPRPKVRSAVLKINLHPELPLSQEELELLRAVVRSAFGKRRKTLANALTGLLNKKREEIEAVLRAEGIDPRRRGETLGVDEFIRLTRALKEATIR